MDECRDAREWQAEDSQYPDELDAHKRKRLDEDAVRKKRRRAQVQTWSSK